MRGALRRRQESLLVGTAGLVLLVAALLPLARVALDVGALRLDLATPHLLLRLLGWVDVVGRLLLRSLALAGAVTALALLLGIPLGTLVARTDVAGRRWVLLLHAFPMFLPPFLLALGWFHLLGRHGLVGTEATAEMLFGAPGVIAVLTLAFTPVVTCLTALGLVAVDPSLEEAARVVATPLRTTARILLPLVWPAAALGGLIVFVLALSELAVPTFLRVRVYPAAVFTRLGGVAYAPGEAVALALPLIGVALVLLALERRLAARRSFAVLGLGSADHPPFALGRWRRAATGLVWLAAVLSLAPVASLAWRAGREGFLAVPVWIGASLVTSLGSAGLAAAVIVAVGLVLGHAGARDRPGARLLDALAVLGFVTPAAVLGVGLIGVWNRPVTHWLYGSTAILVLGYVARYAAVGMRTIAVTVAQSSPSLEDAAATCGARYLRRLLGIVLPLNARGVLAAFFLALVFCLRDLELPVLFYPPGREPLPVRIFTLEANGPEAAVAALAVVHVLVTAAVLAAGLMLVRGRRAR